MSPGEVTEMTLEEIRVRGHAALLRDLGPVGYVRFLQQFDPGRGDYTRERSAWLDSITPQEINDLLSKRGQRSPPTP